MRRHCILFLWAFILTAVPSWAGPQVLIVHSYEPAYSWTHRIQAAIEAELSLANVPFETVYMDTKNRSDPKQILKSAQAVKKRMAEIKPAVVVAVDDNVQKYVVADYVGKSPIQFVFCGVNAGAEAYGYPADNVTGLLERTYPGQTLRMLKVLIPTTLTAACLADDSPTSTVEVARIRTMTQNGMLPAVVVDFYQPTTWSKWTETVRRIDSDPRIDAILMLLFHTVREDDSRQIIDPRKVITWSVTHTKKPIVGLWPAAAENGALCSVVVDPREHGRTAARMALSILKGKRAGDIPIRVNQDGIAILNLRSPAAQMIDPAVDETMVADWIIR